jgi:hypothetical protein
MKLTSMQVSTTLRQFEARAIPENHPIISQLNGLFGEHTFFLDHNGLSILEPVDAAGVVSQSARIVNLANWSDDDAPIGLEPHAPEATDVVIRLRHETKSH